MQTLNIDLEDYDLYRIIKLVTGEILMCTLVDESESTVTFEHPIAVEFVKIVTQKGISHDLSTTAYCPFSSDRTFTVPRNQIQHINDLSKDMVKPYLNMVFERPMDVERVPEGTTVH